MPVQPFTLFGSAYCHWFAAVVTVTSSWNGRNQERFSTRMAELSASSLRERAVRVWIS
jgi:hypothetical protein